MSSLIERGETSPAAVVLEKLATGLGVRATRRSAVTGAWAGVRVGVIPDYALLPGGGFCDTTVYYRRLDPVSSGAPVTG